MRSACAVLVYVAFTYLAPTPGGAGFAEAMAVPFFGPLVDDGVVLLVPLAVQHRDLLEAGVLEDDAGLRDPEAVDLGHAHDLAVDELGRH